MAKIFSVSALREINVYPISVISMNFGEKDMHLCGDSESGTFRRVTELEF